MKKIKIATDTTAENEYRNKVQVKSDTFNELLDYCIKFVSINDLSAFADNPKQHFLTAFDERYKDEFPAIVPLEKRLELSGIELHKIESLQTKFKSIEVEGYDIIKGNAPKIDFGIYATTSEQIKRYEISKKLCEALKELKESGVYTQMGIVNNGLSGVFDMDWSEGVLTPSIRFVMGERRF